MEVSVRFPRHFCGSSGAVGGQGLWAPFARYDSPDDRQAGLPGDIAQGLRELDVHLQQHLLHVQDVRSLLARI